MELLLAEPFSGPVRKKGYGNGIAAVSVRTSELHIGAFLVAVVLSAHQNKAHFAPQQQQPARLGRGAYQSQEAQTMITKSPS